MTSTTGCQAFGKTFFWPTMLGVVAERFPKGGALTLNSIAGGGMLGVGIIGTPLLGNIQDKKTEQALAAKSPAISAKVVGEEKRRSAACLAPTRPSTPSRSPSSAKKRHRS